MTDEVVETRNVFDDPRYNDGKRALVTELEAWSSQQAARYPAEIVSYAKV
jgi:hypothetical protein